MRLAKTKMMVSELDTLHELSSEMLSVAHAICDAIANVEAMVTLARRLRNTQPMIGACGQNCDTLGIKARGDVTQIAPAAASMSETKTRRRSAKETRAQAR